MMFDTKSKCWLFHNWKKTHEEYKILIPQHFVFGEYHPENIQSVKFLIRTCSKCNLRQKKRMLSEGWDNWNHFPSDQILKSKILESINIIK